MIITTQHLIFLAIIICALLLASYNDFTKKRNIAEAALSDVEIALRRRFDIIPNLVNIVKGYASHEHATLEDVIKMRNQSATATKISDHFEVENSLTDTLSRLFALSEKYPDLKANQNFLLLQSELGKIEDDLQNARKNYNKRVRVYNNACLLFPSIIAAKILGFKKMPYFTAGGDAQYSPNTQF